MQDVGATSEALNITVRRAGREDVGAMLELIAALADFEQLAPPDAGARERFAQHGWPSNGQPPRFAAWIAHVHDAQTGEAAPAAYAVTFDAYSSFLARPTLYIEDIFVLPAYRHHGVGTLLMQRLKEDARARECGRMEWVVLDWNTGAQAFYQRLGAFHMPEWFHYRLNLV